MSARQLARTMTKASVETGEASVHSAATIAARLPILAGCLLRADRGGRARGEPRHAEKVAAASEGALAVWAEWQQLMIRSVFRPPSPVALANDLVRLSHKGGQAARRVRGQRQAPRSPARLRLTAAGAGGVAAGRVGGRAVASCAPSWR